MVVGIASILTASEWLMVSVSAPNAVGHGFASQPGHAKDHHKNSRNFTVQAGYIEGRVVCETYTLWVGYIHCTDLLG